jgi:hypothetical protein
MEKDEELQLLLSKYAMHEPSAAFSDNVMKLITASQVKTSAPLISSSLRNILFILFAVVVIALLIVSFSIQPAMFDKQITIAISSTVYTQLFSFFIVFWVVMLVNVWWNKRTVATIKT